MSDSNFDLLGKVATHIWSMHRWQRGLFTVALAMLIGGAATKVTAPPAPQPAAPAAVGAPGSPAAQFNAPSAPQEQPDPTFRQKRSADAVRIGASILGGFLIGFGLRVFLRITAMLLALGALVMMGLSYFNIMNVDLTAAKTKYESAIHWAQDQGYRLKDAAQSHLPSSGSGMVGMFAGFKRRRTSP